MSLTWTPDPCTDNAGWTGETVCRRPYGVAAYGLGPYGRCAIVGGGVWGQDIPCAPFSQQAPLPPMPWGGVGVADTFTANYGWTKPDIGASDDTWGDKWNADLDLIDAQVRAVADGSVGGGITDAPNDGTAYARKSAAWAHLTHTDITDWTASLAPYALTTALASYLPLGGGTLTGGLTLNVNAALTANSFAFFNGAFQWNLNAGNAPIYPQISGPATMHRAIQGATNGSARWNVILGNSAAETGGNVGSDFFIQGLDDGGNLLGNYLTIFRATGAAYLLAGLMGAVSGNNAAAGIVGEVIASLNTAGAGLATSVAGNIASIVLTPGDWDINGEVWLTATGGSITGYHAAINTVSATVPVAPAMNTARATVNAGAAAPILSIPLAPCRASLTVATTYYLIGLAVFAAGTVNGSGKIWARRLR